MDIVQLQMNLGFIPCMKLQMIITATLDGNGRKRQMMKSRDELDRYFEECISRFVDNYEIRNQLIETCNRKYKMKPLRTQMILTGGAAVSEVSEVELFWVLDCLNTVVTRANCVLEDYFSSNKIEQYGNIKAEESKVDFPITINMIKSGDDKWIGAINAKTLINWRNNGYLKYNRNIQRRVKTVLRSGKYIETIDLNLDAVNKMIPLFMERKFISNVLTFNIAENTDFYYDPEEKLIVINSIDGFDMTDGYHRLVALEKVMEIDPEFDYIMEMRLTSFSEEKANFFIWQEEQRTPMIKSSIKSYNMDDISNKISKKINETSSCNLSGNITRGGLIDFSTFSDCIDYFYIRGMKEKEKKIAIVTTTREIIECINILTETNPDIISWNFTKMEILVMIYVFKRLYNVDKSKIPTLFKKMTEFDYKMDKKILYSGSLKAAEKVLNRVYELEISSDV